MATEKWIAGSGQGLSWGAAFNGSDVNSLASGSFVLSSAGAVTNGSALDIFADVSISLGSITPAAPNFIGIYLFPLNQDGSTYGDGQFTAGTQSTGTPSPTCWQGNIIVPTVAQVQTGTLLRIVLPPGSFLFGLLNQSGTTLAASSNAVKYRTYNRQVA